MSEVEFPVVVPIRIDKKRFNTAMGEVGKRTGAVHGQMSGLKKLAGGLFAGFSVAFVVASLKRLATASNDAFLSMDAIRRSAKVTGADLGFLADQADRLGVDFEASALRLGQMSIAFEQSGLGAKAVQESWLGVAEAGVVLGLSAERQGLALLAIQQMASKGVISMEELKRQLAEQIPGALGLMAAGLGKTVPEMIKMIESGEVLARDALPALAREMRKTFGSGVADAITSRQAELGRLRNEWFQLKVAIGEGLPVEEIVRPLRDAIGAIRDWISAGREMDALMDELAPATDRTATSFRNLALEQERAAEAATLLKLIGQYNEFLDLQARLQDAFRDLGAEQQTGTQGIKLQSRLDRLATTIENMPAKIDEARAALANVGTAGDVVTESFEASSKMTEKQREKFEELKNELQDLLGLTPRFIQDLERIAEIELPSGSLGSLPRLSEDAGAIRQQMIDAGQIVAGQVGDRLENALGQGGELIFTAGEEVGNIWSRQITIAGREVGMTWADVFQTAISIASDFGRREQSGFGGNLASDYSDEGGQIGEMAGRIIGTAFFGVGGAIGGAIGKVLGETLGGAIKHGAERGLGDLQQAGDEVATLITQNEGGLGWVISEIGAGFTSFIDGLEGMLRGQIEIGGGGIGLKVEGELIRVFANNVTGIFETIEEATEFAVLEALKSAQISGASPEVEGALRNFAGSTIDELNDVLALAIEFERAQIEPATLAVQDTIGEIFGKIAAALNAGIPIAGGIAMLERTKDSLLGLEQDIVAQKAAEIDAYNAALDMQAIAIQAQMLEIQMMGSVTQARGIMTGAHADMVGAEIMAGEARIQAMGGVVGAQAQMAGASAGLLLELQAILSSIEGLRITGAERAAALARAAARRARGAGRSAGRGSGRSAAEELASTLGIAEDALDSWIDAVNTAMGDLAAAGLTIEQVAESVGQQVRSALGGALGFLESMLGGISDPAERERIERLILELQQREAEIELAMHLANLTRLMAELEVMGLLDDQMRGLLEGALGALEGVAGSFQEIWDLLNNPEVVEELTAAESKLEQARREAAEQLERDLDAARSALGLGADSLGEWIEALRLLASQSSVRLHELQGAIRDFAIGTISGISGFLQRGLEHITDPEQRAQIQALLVRLEQEKFRLELLSHQAALTRLLAELQLLGLLDDETLGWIEGALGALGILGDNLDDIFEGLGDDIIGAGESFAGSVGAAAGAFGQALEFVNIGALAGVTLPANMTLDQLEALWGGQLGGLLGQLQSLEMQALGQNEDPLQALLDSFGEWDPAILEAFGLSMESLTERIDALREAEEARAMEASLGSLADAFQTFIDGPMSGLSARAQFEAQEGDIMARLAAAQAGELSAAELAQLAQDLPGFFQLGQSGLGAGFGQFGANMLGIAAQIPGLAALLGLAGPLDPGAGLPPVFPGGGGPGIDDRILPIPGGSTFGLGGPGRVDEGIPQRADMLFELREIKEEVRELAGQAGQRGRVTESQRDTANDVGAERNRIFRRMPRERAGTLTERR